MMYSCPFCEKGQRGELDGTVKCCGRIVAGIYACTREEGHPKPCVACGTAEHQHPIAREDETE